MHVRRWAQRTISGPSPAPKAVLAYLARYTDRVAISNSRLIKLDEAGVTFRFPPFRDVRGRATATTTGDASIQASSN